jgi:hypothetical protein
MGPDCCCGPASYVSGSSTRDAIVGAWEGIECKDKDKVKGVTSV